MNTIVNSTGQGGHGGHGGHGGGGGGGGAGAPGAGSSSSVVDPTTASYQSLCAGMTYEQFMKHHVSKPGEAYTHTRIGDKTLNVYGGVYTIPPAILPVFWRKYYSHVFENAKQEHLTEKQNTDKGVIVVDFDFRYETSITKRQHSKEHVLDMIQSYIQTLETLVEIPNDAQIPIYIFEKNDVNPLEDVTKDGIHMMIGAYVERPIQRMLRARMLKELPQIWTDIPVTNSWNDVLDEGISRGHTNWQLYGSRKPGHAAYMLKYHFIMMRDPDDDEGAWMCQEEKTSKFNVKERFAKLSVQMSPGIDTEYPSFTLLSGNAALKAEYDSLLNQQRGVRNGGGGAGGGGGGDAAAGSKRLRLVVTGGGGGGGGGAGGGGGIVVGTSSGSGGGSDSLISHNGVIMMDKITSHSELSMAVEVMLNMLEPKEYEIRETHYYTMALPSQYYDPYDKWLRVGLALHNTSDKLFLTWMLFSAKSAKFSYANIMRHYETWSNFPYSPDGLTRRSIMYWAKNDCLEDYTRIRNETIDNFIHQTICNETTNDASTDVDLATVLYTIFKDRFVCVSVKDNMWYEFEKNRWCECDQGNSLRALISKDMHDIYTKKHRDIMDMTSGLDPTSDQYTNARKKSRRIVDICTKLKTTSFKNNIMREVREQFYDKDFEEKIDTRPELLCFKNGVIDFNAKTFRRGQPDDNLSKTTKIDYIPLDAEKHRQQINEINEFMAQLFPEEELRNYMWEHLASTLIGTNREQTFNIYIGGGSNGKSKLIELMSACLGEYKAVLPITAVTQKRAMIGGASPELAVLKGVRYAVMQEPTKGDRINEGILKEITGGDDMTARALFKNTITFVPQFKLVVCTNVLFDIKSNDDGTWRRIRLCPYKSKFCEEPKSDDPEEPYQFLIDKNLDVKIKTWVNVFMSMLVKKAFETDGKVKTCAAVTASSNKYRNTQDYLSEFLRDKIRPADENTYIKKTEVYEEFKKWYIVQHGKNIPKANELYDYMTKKFGKLMPKGWRKCRILYDDDGDDGDDGDDDGDDDGEGYSGGGE
jgi:P4 family phage/plasmid primase-like protien